MDKSKNWLALATHGKIVKSQIYVLYGPNGVGKTSLGSAFPGAAIIDLEDGSQNIMNATRFSRELFPTLESIHSFLQWVLTAEHSLKSLTTDSLEALESIIHAHICKIHEVATIGEVPWGNGPVKAREEMEKIMRTFQKIRDERKMNIIIVAHSQVKTFTDPKTNQSYDRYIMRANDKLASIVRDLSDSVLFINQQVYTETNKLKPNKAKASSSGSRVIHTVWSHAYDAKTRYALPAEIDFTLENIQEVVTTLLGNDEKDLLKEINELKARVADTSLLPKIEESIIKAGTNMAQLTAIKSRIMELNLN